MKQYKDVFADGHTALIPFFVLGDPDFDTSLDLIKTAIDAGAHILELGIPFSDPIADGPTIQKADIRALAGGMNCSRAFELIRQIKAFQHVAATGEVTPSGWQPGQVTLTPGPALVGKVWEVWKPE